MAEAEKGKAKRGRAGPSMDGSEWREERENVTEKRT